MQQSKSIKVLGTCVGLFQGIKEIKPQNCRKPEARKEEFTSIVFELLKARGTVTLPKP